MTTPPSKVVDSSGVQPRDERQTTNVHNRDKVRQLSLNRRNFIDNMQTGATSSLLSLLLHYHHFCASLHIEQASLQLHKQLHKNANTRDNAGHMYTK